MNSSYPKQKLYASSSMISHACQNAEEWTEKDMLYQNVNDGYKMVGNAVPVHLAYLIANEIKCTLSRCSL